MISLLRAEWQKLVKNVKLTGSLVWVFPIAAAAINGLGILLIGFLLGEEVKPGQWTADFAMIWGFIHSFPGNIFGRLLPFAYMGAVFAGEYQWHTWKNLVPRRSRWSLILSKQLVLVAIIVLSFVMTSVVTVLIQALRHQIAGVSYAPTLSAHTLAEFLPYYLREAGLASISLFLMTAFAAVAAILTRSVLGGLLLGLGLSVFELISGLMLAVLGMFINKPEVTNFYRFTPSYSIDNIRSWLVDNQSFAAFLPEFTAKPSVLFSIIILLIWIGGATLLALWLFQRQDLTE